MTTKEAGNAQKALERRHAIDWVPTFGDMQRMMEHMMEGWHPFRTWSVFGPAQPWMPELDVLERDGKIVVRADLAGVNPEEIDVDVEDGILTISGERKQESETKEPDYYRAERHYGRFERSIRLPGGVDAEHVEAAYKDGVLEVTLPKPTKTSNKVKVAVK